MNLKELLKDKGNLKEQLGMSILKSGIFDDLLKTKRNSAKQIVLMKMEEKIFSMSESEIIEHFDNSGSFYAHISFYFHDALIIFSFEIYNNEGNLIAELNSDFKTRKEATIAAAKKLIELSN